MVLAWSRKFYLGTAEIASCVFLVLFKYKKCKVSPKCYLYAFDVNQGKEVGRVQDFLACPQGWKNIP